MSKDNGKQFFQELFEKKHVYSVILERPRSKTKAMMKQKGKAPAKEQVKKHVKKKTTFKVKESQKML